MGTFLVLSCLGVDWHGEKICRGTLGLVILKTFSQIDFFVRLRNCPVDSGRLMNFCALRKASSIRRYTAPSKMDGLLRGGRLLRQTERRGTKSCMLRAGDICSMRRKISNIC